MTKTKYLKPQKGNPHRLAIRQHILPVKSIARFSKSDGRVWVFEKLKNAKRRAKPSDEIFCARRAWDERTEVDFMKKIEDEFQTLASKVIAGAISEIGANEKAIASNFYALWHIRSRQRHLLFQETEMKGVLAGQGFTEDQEESLEKGGIIFVRKGAKMLERQLNGVQIKLKFSQLVHETLADARWGIVQAQQGEFIVPDVPVHTVIPLDPTHCLISPAPNAVIAEKDVAAINREISDASQSYFFARDFSNSPF